MRHTLAEHRVQHVDAATCQAAVANHMQGLEREAVVVIHPLAGYREAPFFATDLGRLCVALSRHRAHATVIVDADTDASATRTRKRCARSPASSTATIPPRRCVVLPQSTPANCRRIWPAVVFGVWSHHCLRLVRRSAMHQPRRYAAATSRGVIFARRTPDGPYQVVSALSLPGWEINQEVTAAHIIKASRPLGDHTSRSSSDPSNL